MNAKKRYFLLSGLFSFLAPGLGQLYNGQLKKGIVIILLLELFYFLIIPFFNLQYSFEGTVCFLLISIFIYLFSIIDAIVNSIKQKTYALKKYNKSYIYISVILLSLISSFLFDMESYLGVESFGNPTSAMEPSILVGDYIMADLDYYEYHDPKPGDVIIFDYPPQPQISYIKRCIAVGGQTVEIINKQVFIDGIKFPDSSYTKFIDPRVFGKQDSKYFHVFQNLGGRDNFGPVKVPENNYFVLGDNRDNSADSRYWGFVPKENIFAKPLFIYFSWNSESKPISGKLRTSRLGLEIN